MKRFYNNTLTHISPMKRALRMVALLCVLLGLVAMHGDLITSIKLVRIIGAQPVAHGLHRPKTGIFIPLPLQ